jgi:RHS repeat-associated protein
MNNTFHSSHLYPFGMEIKERTWSDSSLNYRFGFNGMEGDTEVSGQGNSYIFKYRMHDARLGRFLSVDPLQHQYPFWSQYAFAGNNVIQCIDLEGAEIRIPPITLGWQINAAIIKEAAVVRIMHPNWYTYEIYAQASWNVAGGYAHTGLDILGLIPGIGEPADLINGGIYLLEGDGTNATLSFAATIPIAGMFATAGKYAGKAVKAANGTVTTLDWVKKASGLIDFGSRTKLNKMIKVAAGEEAHHIVPWALKDNTVVQKAAEAGFHMNDATNGIALKKFLIEGAEDGMHGNHPAYNTWVTNQLKKYGEDIAKSGEELTPTMAKDFLENTLLPQLKTHIDDAKASAGNLNDYFKGLNEAAKAKSGL